MRGPSAIARADRGQGEAETFPLERFHRGDRDVLEACYLEHFSTVERAVSGLLHGADRETAIHEVFYRLLSREELRRSFRGGSFSSWIGTVARNHALDLVRRESRQQTLDERALEQQASALDLERQANARLLISRFQRERLPPEWAGVFEHRFLGQLSQRDAAKALGISRTTLAYRELRISMMLKKFLLGSGSP